jgi:hypothetical protein
MERSLILTETWMSWKPRVPLWDIVHPFRTTIMMRRTKRAMSEVRMSRTVMFTLLGLRCVAVGTMCCLNPLYTNTDHRIGQVSFVMPESVNVISVCPLLPTCEFTRTFLRSFHVDSLNYEQANRSSKPLVRTHCTSRGAINVANTTDQSSF